MKKTSRPAPLRFAVVGLGHIAQTAVLPAFRHARRHAKLTAFVSDDAAKLAQLGKKYGVEYLFDYEAYDDCLESGAIDAVYIALPNRLHAGYAVRALERGIHVLCEKPLALTEADCRRMIQASAKSGARLMTAYRLHFDPANLHAVKLATGKLGDLRYFNSSFSYQLHDPNNIRLESEEGGDPLWDLGVYCVNAARYLFRREPMAVSAMGSSSADPRFREITEMVAVQLKFPGDRIASFTVSFGAADIAGYDLVGTKGRLRLDDAYEYAYPRELRWKAGGRRGRRRFPKTDQFAPELVYFAECVRGHRQIEPSGLEGWADVRIIRAIEKAMRTGRVVRLDETPRALTRRKRPSLKLVLTRPAVEHPPKPVHAASPSGE